MSWPRKIFLESTALFQLGTRLETVDLAKLLELRPLLKFELFVAEVSWREYLRDRKKEINDCLTMIRQAKAELTKHEQPSTELDEAERKIIAYLQNLHARFEEKAKNLGITILPLPSIDLTRLLQMSLDQVPPFEDAHSDTKEKTKEKGFRDALIMFTILEDVRNRPEDNPLVITRDNRLKAGLERFLEHYATRLQIVSNFEEATNSMYQGLQNLYRAKLRRQSEEAKSMLLSHKAEIATSIQNIRELTEDDLGQGILSRALSGFYGESGGEQLDIEEVRSLAFDEVESAIWKDKEQPISRILFKLRCTAHVVVRLPAPFPFIARPVFPVGGGKRFRATLSVSGETTEKDLPLSLYGEAKLRRNDGDWELINLRVDKSPPSTQELVELARAATNTTE